MSEEITLDEWLAALEKAEAPTAGALTLAEWQRRLGLNGRRTHEWARRGLEHGWLALATASYLTLAGVRRRAPGFRLVPQQKKRARK